jgi:hypothetical protein
MKCSIMQPTYLPWSGYFNLIYTTDIFIFLDDAQYSKGSWHNRNLIINNSKRTWITIPVKKHNLKTNLNKIYLYDLEKSKKEHINLLKQSYYRHPFYDSVEEIFNFFLTVKTNILSELNIILIKFICEKLFIKNKFIQSSDLEVKTQKRTDKLIGILKNFNVTEYLSPQGSMAYLLDDNFYNKTEINLKFSNFKTREYPQHYNKNSYFDKLSVIDVIANLGWSGAKDYIIDNS